MGASPNPALASMLPTILGALSKRTQDGAGSPAAAAANQGADPKMVLNQLNQIHQALGLVFVRTFQNLPNVANQVSATMKSLSRAIKEAQQGANVTEAVGQADEKPPINFSAAQQGTGAQGQPEQPPMGQ